MLTSSGEREQNAKLNAGGDYTLRLWDLETGQELRRFEGHTWWVCQVVFSPDGKRAASASWDKTARLWDPATGAQLRVFTGHTDGISAVEFSPDSHTILTGSLDRTMRLWDVETGEERMRFVGHKDTIPAVGFSPDGRQVLSAASRDLRDGKWLPGTDHTIRLWDVATGEEVKRIEGHTGWIKKAGFVRDKRNQLVSCSFDRTVRFWDAATGQELRRLTHPDRVYNAVVSPDGRRVFSSCRDQLLRVWDAETGQVVARFPLTETETGSLALTPDGRWALSGGRGHVVCLWRLPEPTPP